MKAVVLNVLKSSAVFSALCSSVVACGPGGGGYGGYGGYGGGYSGGYYQSSEYSSTPAPAPVVKRPAPVVTTKKVVPARPAVNTQSAAAKQVAKTPAFPVGRISEVAAEDDAPVGNLRPAPAVTDEETEVKPEVSKPEPPQVADDSEVKEVDPSDLGGSETKAADESPISDAMKGLLGTWRAVSRQGEGSLATIELQLNDNGTAQLTTPGKDGKTSTTTRKANFDNQELKLTGGDKDISLGKLVESDARQMVLDRGGRQVTFVRVN